MVGLNRTTIIPPNWELRHRPVAASTMTACAVSSDPASRLPRLRDHP